MKTKAALLQEIDLLRDRLEEAEAALEAIRSGEVDALVVSSFQGDQVFTLQGAEHPYRVMVETMNEGAATVLEDGSILYANPRLAAMLGEPLETLIGSSLLDYISPEDVVLFEGLVEQGFRSSSRAELRFLCRDRSSVPVLVSFSHTQLEGAQALCLVATDLTEQKRSEEILAAENLARSILDQAAEAILVCDPGGVIIRANQAAFQIFPQNPLYKPFEEALPLVYKQSDEEGGCFSVTKVLRGGSYQGIEAEYPPSGGGNRTFLLSAAPLLKGQNKVIGCVITLAEITDRKQAEEAIKTYSEKLERSNKELQQFAFVASHDLQEPLRKIEAFSRQIENASYLQETERDYLQRMLDAARRMRNMIDDLLQLSRVTTRNKPYEPVDLNLVAKMVVGDLEQRLQQTAGRVEIHPLPVIDADAMQMHQLILNLVGNAVKYHRQEVPPVVQLGYRDSSPGWVEIYVQDNGIGFDMRFAGEIFQPFRRLHGRNEYEGTGIGLAICHKIAERHGGRITAQSTPGQGSTFLVALPVKQVKG